jgi:beta-lactamase regulating signal transducer with metallopeptidase domain
VLRRRLRAESELACDAEALRFGFRPSQYAAELLAIAKSVGRHPMLSSSGIGMTHSSDLEDRVRAILNPAALSIFAAEGLRACPGAGIKRCCGIGTYFRFASEFW